VEDAQDEQLKGYRARFVLSPAPAAPFFLMEILVRNSEDAGFLNQDDPLRSASVSFRIVNVTRSSSERSFQPSDDRSHPHKFVRSRNTVAYERCSILLWTRIMGSEASARSDTVVVSGGMEQGGRRNCASQAGYGKSHLIILSRCFSIEGHQSI
jgi:hypothetical protein